MSGMAIRKKDTLLFAHPPVIAAWAAVGGRQEAKGPLAPGFDELVEDASFAAEGCRSLTKSPKELICL